ncbi:MAG: N-acetyltransferase family protein [Frankia sp.]
MSSRTDHQTATAAVRPAQPADVPRLVALVGELAAYERSASEVELTDELLAAALFGAPPTAYCHVAVDEAGTVAGFALWFVTFSTWTGKPGLYLEDLYVRPESRRAGHGRALLAELARVCLARGYPRLEWSVLDWNTPAQDFYRTLGAVPQDEWTRWRMTDTAITALATSAGQVERQP